MEVYRIFSNIIWQPGIGDNNGWGWSAVALYYVTALLAGALVWQSGRSQPQSVARQDRRFFAGLALLFLGLGLARQTGALRWLTNLGRAVAWEQGWYTHRTLPQQQIIAGIYYSAIVLLLILVWLNRRTLWRHGLLLLGVVLLLGYLGVRAVSLHSIDYMLTYRRIGGIPWGSAIELGSLLFIGTMLLLLYTVQRWKGRLLLKKV